jgi:voltage-gated potassium channel
VISVLLRLAQARRFRAVAFTDDELKRDMTRSMLVVMALFSTHIGAMMYFEGLNVSDAAWLTFTTATTVGYGDISASTPWGRTATVILLYLGGIFILAKAAGDYFDYRTHSRMQKKCGNWRWDMDDHILIINTPREQGEKFFLKVIEQIRASAIYGEKMIQLVTRQFPQGLPEKLARLEGLAHHNGDGCDLETLLRVDAPKACAIIVLAALENDAGSDSRTLDILDQLQNLNVDDALIVAECVDDRNRARFRKLGASILIRPVRAYPEMLVRGLVAPGSEQIIENLFTSTSDEYARYDLPVTDTTWAEIVCKLIQQDLGTAVGYISAATGELETNPSAHTQINGSALFLIANEGAKPNTEQIRVALAAKL